MICIGDTVKVIGTTNCGGFEKECIPIGTICRVVGVSVEVSVVNGKYRIIGIVPEKELPFNGHVEYWYLEKDLEKGNMEWIVDKEDTEKKVKPDKDLLEKSCKEIVDFRCKLGENIYDSIQEEDYSIYVMAKDVINVILACDTERDFKIANNMLMAVCGYDFKTLVERIVELDELEEENKYAWKYKCCVYM